MSLAWRGAPEQNLSYREWMRQKLPGPTIADKATRTMNGIVVEDLDVIIRSYGPLFGSDAIGKLRLIEIKTCQETVKGGQHNTFRLIDQLLRAGDSDLRYDGFYVLRSNDPDWFAADAFSVTSIADDYTETMTPDQVIAWLQWGYTTTSQTHRRQ